MSLLLRKTLNDFEIPPKSMDASSDDSSDSDEKHSTAVGKLKSKSKQSNKTLMKKKAMVIKKSQNPDTQKVDKTKALLEYYKKELSENRFQENLSNLKILSKLPNQMLKYANKVNSKQKERSKYKPLKKKKAVPKSVFSESDFKKFEEDLQTLF